MGTKDARIDVYIAKSAAFAKPILIHIRKLVHTQCPGGTETIKWSLNTRAIFFATWRHSRRIVRLAFGMAHCSRLSQPWEKRWGNSAV